MLDEPLPIMDKQRVIDIQEKPRLKYVKNEQEFLLHHKTAHDKFMRGNQNNNRNLSLMNFTIENTSSVIPNSKSQNQNQRGIQQNYLQRQAKRQSRTGKSLAGRTQNSSIQNQPQQETKKKEKNILVDSSSNLEELQWGEQDYQKNHDCQLDSETNRCKICGSVMKYFYHSGDQLLQKPFSIYYVDYHKTFSRKLECHTLPKFKQKQFLIINYLPYMKEWAYYVLDRQKYYGLEEYIYEQKFSILDSSSTTFSIKNQQPVDQSEGQNINKSIQHSQSAAQFMSKFIMSQRIPFSLKQQLPQFKFECIKSKNQRSLSLHNSQVLTNQTDFREIQQYNESTNQSNQEITFGFDTFTVLGNFESSNINFCTVDKKESKCQILLRSDTNTKGCLHWFMFTVKINNLFKTKKQTEQIDNKESITIEQEEKNQTINQDVVNQNDQSFDKKWIVIEDDDQDVEDKKEIEENQSKTITFSILNNKRNGYLYKEGMQIAIFDSSKPDKGWHRGGENIFYYRSNVDHQFFQANNESKNQQRNSILGNNNINGNTANLNQNIQNGSYNNSNQTDALNSNTNLYSNLNQQLQSTLIQPQIQPNSKRGFQTMDFSFTFTENGQRVTFAYCYPYTLSDLMSYLEQQEQKLIYSFLEYQNLDQQKKQLIIKTSKVLYKKRTIATSRIGLPIILLKITSSKNPKLTKNKKKKKVIFIIARQHPGETPSSFVCEGFISYLLTDTIQAKYLLDNYIFKIVPMMNPDGVVVGNSRCNLSGSDLNRKWDNPDPVLHPEVFEVKKEIKKSHLKREVAIFCDLHGHSMKKHAFFYGCNKTSDGGASTWTQVRLIPRILSKKNHLFSIKDCKFRVTDDKKNTARVICWNELKISNSFTLETSFFGYDDLQNDGKPTHFTTQDLSNLGKSLCESIVEYTLVMDILMAELVETRGWLKPFRLFQLTGESAQNKILRNMKEQKKIEKQKRIENNLLNIQQEKEKNLNNLQQQIKQKEKRCLTPSLINGNTKKDTNFLNSPDCADELLKSNDLDSKQELLLQLCPDMKVDWRDYFGKDELEKAFKKIDKGEDPNDQESASGSDSEAEVDIFKDKELQLSNEAKNRKKSKKKKQQTIKEKEKNGNNLVEVKINNQGDNNTNNSNQDQNNKKKPLTVYSQSQERNRWNPSPIIQNYKQQLEMKKQQLKKQSYPIAKVGQNFASAYQTQNQTNQEIQNSANNQPSQATSQQSSPQQTYKNQYPPAAQAFNQYPTNAYAKNSVNGTYLEKKLIELQQVQLNQSYQYNQSRNSQSTIYQNLAQYKQRNSVMVPFEDNRQNTNTRGISSSNSEANPAFRLNTSDIQSRLYENQNIPISNNSSRNYGKQSTSNSTNSSNLAQQNTFAVRRSSQFQQKQNQEDNQQFEENQEKQSLIIKSQGSTKNGILERKHKLTNQNITESSQKAFIVDDDDEQDEEQSQFETKFKNSIDYMGKAQRTPKNVHSQIKSFEQLPPDTAIFEDKKNQIMVQSRLKLEKIQACSVGVQDEQEINQIEVQILNQKNNMINQENMLQTSNLLNKNFNDSISNFKQKNAQSDNRSNNNFLEIPHNFVSFSSSKKGIQQFYADEQAQSSGSNSNSNNIQYNQTNNYNQSSSNSDIINITDDLQLTNKEQTTKQIAKNASNFDRKIRAQAPLRQFLNTDNISQISSFNSNQQSDKHASNNMFGQQILNNKYLNQERLAAISLNNTTRNFNSTNYSLAQNKHKIKKHRARSIQETKAQLQIQQQLINNNFNTQTSQQEKLNFSTDEQKLQMYQFDNGNNFVAFKNFSNQQYQPFAQNNIRIRKLNFI
ncbi:zinc carboxypeptidase family protein (macronuclear) [Tetrahymena thermophila SB210]|uniref:Zinc carboxypeptidase family protein n=1 Tax=Tetrahymena thermophila (strain SB210) TaxID=312017 RepID=I7M656_TETTS|nr:zinc carboxypeptidase family protein [Tetrahymena thermophila SB210]EAR84316.2 zinc carboxypeptidase family protein [Tetrahymena thermophila SB210]|eukprot:XP_001031979.2 zinc carboxypeptidase family protein [Tetrahymena thermophila SB210]